jgi:hypothetical protein
MTVVTEGKHAGEFLLSEAQGDRSRESAYLKSGEVVEDGQYVALDGDELVAFPAGLNTDGDLTAEIEGIVIGDHDATDGAIEVAYIARDAEVRDSSIKYPDEDSDGETDVKSAVIQAAAAKGIITRYADPRDDADFN